MLHSGDMYIIYIIFIIEGFTVRFVGGEGDSLDPVFSNKVYWVSTDLTDHLSIYCT
jgi:hypothetical protein